MDLQPIKEALKAATPGPWLPHEHQDTDEVFGVEVLSAHNGGTWPVADMQHDEGHPDPYGQIRANAHLIANAPTWLAQLVAEVERLRSEMHWAAESLEELGATGSAHLTRLRALPPEQRHTD
jgi:hypothetical protein